MSTQSSTADQQHHTPRTLGLARWVQLAFMVFGALLLLVLDRTISIIWDKFAEPEPLLVTLAAALLAVSLTVVAYRHPTVSRLASEVVGELAKVTWPSRDEVQVSTLVVIITSFIASVIVGSFDAAWSAITDLIYKV
jgi:preprotein translocase SecE subunit